VCDNFSKPYQKQKNPAPKQNYLFSTLRGGTKLRLRIGTWYFAHTNRQAFFQSPQLQAPREGRHGVFSFRARLRLTQPAYLHCCCCKMLRNLHASAVNRGSPAESCACNLCPVIFIRSISHHAAVTSLLPTP